MPMGAQVSLCFFKSHYMRVLKNAIRNCSQNFIGTGVSGTELSSEKMLPWMGGRGLYYSGSAVQMPYLPEVSAHFSQFRVGPVSFLNSFTFGLFKSFCIQEFQIGFGVIRNQAPPIRGAFLRFVQVLPQYTSFIGQYVKQKNYTLKKSLSSQYVFFVKIEALLAPLLAISMN